MLLVTLVQQMASKGSRRAAQSAAALLVCSKAHIPCHTRIHCGRKQDIVILGTGAFALEAMEAAHRGQARNITLLSSPRDRRAHSDA